MQIWWSRPLFEDKAIKTKLYQELGAIVLPDTNFIGKIDFSRNIADEKK